MRIYKGFVLVLHQKEYDQQPYLVPFAAEAFTDQEQSIEDVLAEVGSIVYGEAGFEVVDPKAIPVDLPYGWQYQNVKGCGSLMRMSPEGEARFYDLVEALEIPEIPADWKPKGFESYLHNVKYNKEWNDSIINGEWEEFLKVEWISRSGRGAEPAWRHPRLGVRDFQPTPTEAIISLEEFIQREWTHEVKGGLWDKIWLEENAPVFDAAINNAGCK